MSNQQSSHTSYSSSSYSSYTSSGPDGQPQTKSYTERGVYDSRDGGMIERTSAETGKPTLIDRTEIPAGAGRALGEGTSGGGSSAGTQGRIEDVTDDQADKAAREQEYLERMEDEYAKREGGA